MVEVVGGVDSVVHMAGDPEVGASFQSVYENNILGTYCIYEAARRTGVPQVIFASTNHVTGMYELEGVYTQRPKCRCDLIVTTVLAKPTAKHSADTMSMNLGCG